MKNDLRYTPTDCYETFPFPEDLPPILTTLGDSYDALRREIMTEDNIGLTKLYNAFHTMDKRDPRLDRLRALQVDIDTAVRDAYGWGDIDLEHGFHNVPYLPENDNLRYTISEKARLEILRRLSALNRSRAHAEK